MAFDVTGLAQGVRSGVQNVLWSFIDAVSKNPSYAKDIEFMFYDRSGYFNIDIHQLIDSKYKSDAFGINSSLARKISRGLFKYKVLGRYDLTNAVNLVWNYDIYNPKKTTPAIYVHDILPIEYPQWFSKDFYRLTIQSLEFAKEKSKYVICNSHYVKSRIADVFGVDDARIQVVYPSINTSYLAEFDQALDQHILAHYGLEREGYIISSGFVDPRKNLERQVHAFLQHIKGANSSLKYVLTGPKNNFSQDILNLIEKCGCKDNIVFLGYVPQHELCALVRGSKFVMYCSLAEGFGLPIIEAMASSVPVITSSTTSMMEIGRDRAILVDPTEVESIKSGIETLISIPRSIRDQQTASNFEYAKEFTSNRFLFEYISAIRAY